MEFSLEGKPFIELNRLIKYVGWAESGGEANSLIDAGKLKVNGKQEFRRRNKLMEGFEIQFGKEKCIVVA